MGEDRMIEINKVIYIWIFGSILTFVIGFVGGFNIGIKKLGSKCPDEYIESVVEIQYHCELQRNKQ
jgi:hypothetical protein